MSCVNYISLCGLNGFQDVVDIPINFIKVLRLTNVIGQIQQGNELFSLAQNYTILSPHCE